MNDWEICNKQAKALFGVRGVKQSGNKSWHRNRLSDCNLIAQPGVFK
jgi:hypothetical protein